MALLWAAPLLFFASDAHAWGLQTHLFFAQYALAFVPLADPDLRAAAARLPRLVLAGACLPDVAIVGRLALRTAAFRRAHLWATLRRLAATPRDERDRALALGYATHLLSDVIAHNEFVPEHEARIGRGAMIAHLVSEWAMDRHVGIELQPADVLEEAGPYAAQFLARALPCGERLARRALHILARGDRLLRRSRTPDVCRAALGVAQPRAGGRFSLYLDRTTRMLSQVEAALAGVLEDWCGLDPEGSEGDGGTDARAGEHIARIMQAEYHARCGGEQRERHQDHSEAGVM